MKTMCRDPASASRCVNTANASVWTPSCWRTNRAAASQESCGGQHWTSTVYYTAVMNSQSASYHTYSERRSLDSETSSYTNCVNNWMMVEEHSPGLLPPLHLFNVSWRAHKESVIMWNPPMLLLVCIFLNCIKDVFYPLLLVFLMVT